MHVPAGIRMNFTCTWLPRSTSVIFGRPVDLAVSSWRRAASAESNGQIVYICADLDDASPGPADTFIAIEAIASNVPHTATRTPANAVHFIWTAPSAATPAITASDSRIPGC